MFDTKRMYVGVIQERCVYIVWLRSSFWMKSSPVVIERLTANAEFTTVLGSIPASSDTVESEGRPDEAVLNKVMKKSEKFPLILNVAHLLGVPGTDPRTVCGSGSGWVWPVSSKEQNASRRLLWGSGCFKKRGLQQNIEPKFQHFASNFQFRICGLEKTLDRSGSKIECNLVRMKADPPNLFLTLHYNS